MLKGIAEEQRGIVLVTGTTGSGKSTTLAAMIDHINQSSARHVVTIEDPIEFLHQDKRSIVNQREIGQDTESFGRALRRVLRQDPDVILIGEMRDEETAEAALYAAATGHLVLSTVHATDAIGSPRMKSVKSSRLMLVDDPFTTIAVAQARNLAGQRSMS